MKSRRVFFLLTVCGLLVLSGPAQAASTTASAEELLEVDLGSAVKEWIKSQTEEHKSEFGKPTKRGYYSRSYKKIDDATYVACAHIESAGSSTKTTERFEITLKKDGAWKATGHELQDTYAGMHRELGARCYPFQKFEFDREGVKMSASNGEMCESYYQGRISGMAVQGENASYRFDPPPHALNLHMFPDFHSVFKSVTTDHERELQFDPAAFLVNCDPDTCDELKAEMFTGLNTEPPPTDYIGFGVKTKGDWAKTLFDQTDKERRDSPFAHFSEPVREGRKTYSVWVARELNPFRYPGSEDGFSDIPSTLPGSGVVMSYDNWGGYEVSFAAYPRRIDDPDQLFGNIFGFYTEETLKTTSPYDIEQRDDYGARWHQVYKVNGEVDLGLEDPEILEADIEFGIELKEALQKIPFFIQSIPQRDFNGKNKSRTLEVNSVQLDGEEVTWTRTNQLGGLIILPEKMPAGTKLELRMNFKTRAMVKRNPHFSQVSRFGWMPFVRFGDFIDDFALTIRAPAGYKVLGIGHKVSQEQVGETTVTHWKADSPVVFPSITFGGYEEATAGKKFEPARKIDGTAIPITVHVDKTSAQAWDITPAKLRPIAQQATNSINLYRELSGLDYPYGELNFVNDPAGPLLYGQAPSSLIYLGQGVFRGAGTLAPFFRDATSISKFLQSVTAHEVGHQWWGSRVSNKNGRNYWFVESLAEYFSAIYLEQVYGEKAYLEQVDEWRRTILDRQVKASVQNSDSVWAGEGGSGSPRQAAIYNKGPYAFHMLRVIFGDEKFFDALKKFSMELDAKREIVTLDIEDAAETALGGIGPDGLPYKADLGWFFDQWIRGTGVPQYRFVHDASRTEDGNWLVEGYVEQRVLLGSSRNNDVMAAPGYRGKVFITVKGKGEDYHIPVLVEGPQSQFRFKVPEKPVEIVLNEKGESLAHDVLSNKAWD